jgi:hypothetical protein
LLMHENELQSVPFGRHFTSAGYAQSHQHYVE